jgi:hypothetical protein
MFHVRAVAATGLWFAATLSTSGCLFQKKHRAYAPPPLRPPAPITTKAPFIVDPVPLIEVASIELPNPGPINIAPLPPPPKPSTTPTKPKPSVAVAPPKPATAPSEAPPTLARIAQILTPQQIHDYNREIDDALNRVTEALKLAAKKNLGADQRDTVERMTAFQKQAVQAREEDLVTAVNYAKRADVLAKELLARLP